MNRNTTLVLDLRQGGLTPVCRGDEMLGLLAATGAFTTLVIAPRAVEALTYRSAPSPSPESRRDASRALCSKA